MVMPPDEESLSAFLIRTGGEILATETMKEIEGLNPAYLVRVYPGGANLDRFNADLRSPGAVGTGEWIVSSEVALRTLTLVAREAASQGIAVAINPVTVQHDFARRALYLAARCRAAGRASSLH